MWPGLRLSLRPCVFPETGWGRGRWRRCESIRDVRTPQLRRARGGRRPKVPRGLEVPGPGSGWCRRLPSPAYRDPNLTCPCLASRTTKLRPVSASLRGSRAALWFAARREADCRAGRLFLQVNAVNLNFRTRKLAPFPLRSIHHQITPLNARVALSGGSWSPLGRPIIIIIINYRDPHCIINDHNDN